jgi:predicted ribosomally synthesized peptide with nif11-like leader
MSVESAKTYIERMRLDEPFRHAVNALSEDEAASWLFLKENGYEFSMTEFQQARDLIYAEYNITPL